MRISNDMIFRAMFLAGVVVAFAGVLVDWVTISITMADGSVKTLKYTGLEVYLDIDGGTTPISTFVPPLFMIIASMDVAIIALMKQTETKPIIPLFVIGMSFIVMYIAGMGAVDSALYWNDSPLPAVHGVPDWISNLTTGDVSGANISSGHGYQLSLLGILIIWTSVIVDARKDKMSLRAESP